LLDQGPHDAYGKDAKHLCRTAERNQKARLASTHDVYYFCATNLPRPRRGATAEQIVAPLTPVPAPPPPPPAEQEAAAAAVRAAPTREAAAAMAARMEAAGMTAPAIEPDEPVAEEAAAVAEEAAADVATAAADAAEDAAIAEADAAAEAESAAAAEAAALDEEAEEEEADDFIFDECGARVGADHSDEPLEAAAAAATTAAAATAAAAGEPPPKRKRAARKRLILSQAPGMEASTEGETRTEEEQPKRAGLFTASNYFWLYYSAKPGLKEVAVGKLAAAGECHAHLDEAADADADSIPGSNSTYEFAGVCADQPQTLYTRTYSCACRRCRPPSAVGTEYAACPYLSTVRPRCD
jgi:hypothetical protein